MRCKNANGVSHPTLQFLKSSFIIKFYSILCETSMYECWLKMKTKMQTGFLLLPPQPKMFKSSFIIRFDEVCVQHLYMNVS